MKIQILSDLHLDHGGTLPAHRPDADVIVLAGDLCPYTEGLIEMLARRWKSARHIVYVLGNHEFYGTRIDRTRARIAKECAAAGIHLLDPGTVRIEGVRWIGATLWTDFALDGKANEVGAHLRASRSINDFSGMIRYRDRDFTTGDSVRYHRTDRAYIERELRRARQAGEQVVVVTHHAPSPRSVRPWFRGDPLNPAFASDLDRLIKRYQPSLWIHGHMHDPVNERLGETRIVANPAGYAHENKRGFDPALCMELPNPEPSRNRHTDAQSGEQ